MKYVERYHRRTGRKRRIPESWLADNVFGKNWLKTPRDKARQQTEAAAPATASQTPAPGDTPRKDQ